MQSKILSEQKHQELEQELDDLKQKHTSLVDSQTDEDVVALKDKLAEGEKSMRVQADKLRETEDKLKERDTSL